MSDRDPIKAWVRDSRAQRRVGPDALCASCRKERRPFALIRGRTPPICFGCDRVAHGCPPAEDHHLFGERNSAAIVTMPINDHRAVLSVAQYEWPRRTLENADRSPLREGSARLRGRGDLVAYMVEDSRANAELLDYVDDLLTKIHGPNWLPKLEALARRSSKRRVRRGQ
jgi:hypothetical protein